MSSASILCLFSSLTSGRSSYVQSWVSLLRTHELLGDNRLRFAGQLSDMSDELIVLGKEVEKNRKTSKDLGTRLERGLAEQESLVDKVRSVLLPSPSTN